MTTHPRSALLQKRIPVGAKEESWVSAQEILKRFSRDSQESLEVQKGLFLLICLLFLLVLTLVCLFVADLLVVNTAFC